MQHFKRPITLICCALLSLLLLGGCVTGPKEPVVLLSTTQGDITIQLHPEQAPKTVELFLKHVDAAFYTDVIFHRVIRNFMAQTGGFTEGFNRKEPLGTVVNESLEGLPNVKGSVAMARTQNPDSASSQFYINVVNNPNLDAKGQRAGYTVFGTVTSGLDIAIKITELPQGVHGRTGHRNAPNETVKILSAKRMKPAPALSFESSEPKK